MDSITRVLKKACLSLESSKITERKESGSQILHLLTDKKLVNYLNDVSKTDSKDRQVGRFTWNEVFKCSINYFKKEIARVENLDQGKSSSKMTAATETKRKQMRKNAICVTQRVLKSACTAGVPHISGVLVLEFVMYLLDKSHPYVLEYFCLDAIALLQNFILKYPQYYSIINSDEWTDLFKVVIFIFKKDWIDKSSVFTVLERMVACSYVKANPSGLSTSHLQPVLAFLNSVLMEEGEEHRIKAASKPLIGDWLRLTLTMIYTCGAEWRDTFCLLTEKHSIAIFIKWSCQISPEQNLLIQYLNVSFALHHPHKDGKCFPSASNICDADVWDSVVKSTYYSGLEYIAKLSADSRQVTSSRKTNRQNSEVQKKAFVDLMARVCCQIFTMSDLLKTEVSDGDSLESEGTSRKKKKDELSLSHVCYLLKTEGQNTLIWYDVFLCLLTKHKCFWVSDRSLLLFDTLVQVLHSTKSCQDGVISCLAALSELCSPEIDSSRWIEVWDLVIRLVHGKQCLETGLKLLLNMQRRGLSVRPQQLVSLICQDRSGVLLRQMNTLETLEQMIVQGLLPNSLQIGSSINHEKTPTHLCLLNALLLPESADLFSPSHPLLYARVIVQLCSSDVKVTEGKLHTMLPPKKEDTFHHCLLPSPSTTPLSGYPLLEAYLTQLESTYTACALALPYPPVEGVKASVGEVKTVSVAVGGGRLLDCNKEDSLIEILSLCVDKFLVQCADSPADLAVISAAKVATMMVYVMSFTHSNRLTAPLTSLLTKCCSLSSHLLSLSKWTEAEEALSHLTAIYQVPKQSPCPPFVAPLITAPNPLVRDLMGCVSGRVRALTGTNEISCSQMSTALTNSLMSQRNISLSRNLNDGSDDEDANVTMFPDVFSDEETEMEGENCQVDPCSLIGFHLLDPASRFPSLHPQDACCSASLQFLSAFYRYLCANLGEKTEETVLVEEEALDDLLEKIESLLSEYCQLAESLVRNGGSKDFVAAYQNYNIAMLVDGCSRVVKFYSVSDSNSESSDDAVDVLDRVVKVIASLMNTAVHVPAFAAHALDIVNELLIWSGRDNDAFRVPLVELLKYLTSHNKFFGEEFACKLTYTHYLLAQNAPLKVWSDFTEGNEEALARCLTSQYNRVRVISALSLQPLLSLLAESGEETSNKVFAHYLSRPVESFSSVKLEGNFKGICTAIVESLTINTSRPVLEHLKADELRNRLSTFLLSLGSVCVWSPYLQPQALYGLIHGAINHNIHLELIRTLLQRVCESCKLDQEIFTSKFIGSVLDSWFRDKHALSLFPHALFNADDFASLVRAHGAHIVYKVLLLQRDALRGVAADCGVTEPALIEQFMPAILAKVAPSLIQSSDSILVPTYLERVEQRIFNASAGAFNHLAKCTSADVIKTFVSGDRVHETVIELLKLSNFEKSVFSDGMLPVPAIPFYQPELVAHTIGALGEFFEAPLPLLVVACEHKYSMYKVVSYLQCLFIEADTNQDIRRALAQANAFVCAVLKIISLDRVIKFSTFLLTQLLDTLTRHITRFGKLDSQFVIQDIKMVSDLIETALQNSELCKSLRPVLPLIFTRLRLVVMEGKTGCEQIAAVMEMLIKCTDSSVRSLVALLPPLATELSISEDARLQHLKNLHIQVLQENSRKVDDFNSEVKIFLGLKETNEWTLEHIYHLLLKAYTNSPQGIDRHTSQALSDHLVSHFKGERKSKALDNLAAKCLGLLRCVGVSDTPPDLRDHWRDCVTETVKMNSSLLTIVITLRCLLDRLAHPDVQVCIASGHALFSILKKCPTAVSVSRSFKDEMLRRIYPFIPRKVIADVPNDTQVIYSNLSNSCVWTHGESADSWLRKVVRIILTQGCDSISLNEVISVCSLDYSLCRSLFPLIMHSLLSSKDKQVHEGRRNNVSAFFSSNLSLFLREGSQHCELKKVANCLLDAIEYLWQWVPPFSYSSRRNASHYDSSLWLDVSASTLAEAALECQRYHLAVALIEEQEQWTDWHLLAKVYSALGNSAGVVGCNRSNGSNSLQEVLFCQHSGKYEEALAISNASNDSDSIISSLSRAGLHALAVRMKPEELLTEASKEAHWESAWRLAQWSDGDALSSSSPSTTSFHKSIHACVSSSAKVSEARENLLPKLEYCHSSLMDKLMLLSEIETSAVLSTEKLVHTWRNNPLDESALKDDTVIALRSSLLLKRLHTNADSELSDLLVEMKIQQSKLGIAKSILGSTESCLQVAASIATASKSQCMAVVLERAKEAFRLGGLQRANALISTILEELDSPNSEQQLCVYSNALLLRGRVNLKLRIEPSSKVIANSYEKCIAQIQQCDVKSKGLHDILLSSYHEMARVCDQLYSGLRTYLSSDEATMKRKNIRYCREQTKKFETLFVDGGNTNKEIKRSETIHRKNAQLDEDSLKAKTEEMHCHLSESLTHYLKYLSYDTCQDIATFRAVSLWLENHTNEKVNAIVMKAWPSIKTYKLVPLMYQLIARICTSGTSFSLNLKRVIGDVVEAHPHHALPVLLMMANARFDDRLKENATSKVRKSTVSVAEEERVKAAHDLVNMIKRKGDNIRAHVIEMDEVCKNYLKLANWSDKAMGKNPTSCTIPSNHPLLSLNNTLEHTAPLTWKHKIQPSGVYHLPTILKWERKMELVGGVNVPKKLQVVSSDGVVYNELLKGKDDLRQDAVLQQVFTTVNELLKSDPNTRNEELFMKTYMVVPLSQATGLLQWCSNSNSLDRIINSETNERGCGLHRKYRPTDTSYLKCIRKYADSNKIRGPNALELKHDAYQKILADYKPVMNFMFHEIANDIRDYYKKRHTYTKSLATSSAAGYIIGLGDRHTNNMLLNMRTAEIIQIDLGIAFELGKVLPTPETVPFRLTQNLVHALGPCGVDGNLRKGLEDTLRVMRDNKMLFTTVVEVLRHDPLQQWELKPEHIIRLQALGIDTTIDSEMLPTQDGDYTSITPGDNGPSLGMADRCLRRVQEKLSGVEDGVTLTISEQVSTLILKATNPYNLCQIFQGWKPFV